MTSKESRPGAARAPGIARRTRLIDAARQLLCSHDIDELSLADVAARARIPKGSAYHYYGDIMELYGHLLAQIEEELLADLRRPLRGPALHCWADVVAALIRRGVRFYDAHPAARQLMISPKTPAELKLRDRHSDVRIGQLFEQQISVRFALPAVGVPTAVFFRSVEIADLMFSLSMLEHGTITAEMTAEAICATVGYLRGHIPEVPEMPEESFHIFEEHRLSIRIRCDWNTEFFGFLPRRLVFPFDSP